MHHGKAAHRAGTEDQQRNAGNQRGHVGIDDRRPGPIVARDDSRLRRAAVAQFFTDALVDQHVGVNRHTQRQGDGGNPRQG